ncbi:MAG: hypothetical protein REI78_14285 [Pedobacter sp.]|nr:hypothetical protein [Pedobacter sp.]MDQ8054196.1 hypothetical protein [Pedobacter sp.]
MSLKNLKFFCLSIALLCFIACKKSSNEPDVPKTPQLTKINSWNPGSGAEASGLEISYDAKGNSTGILFGGATYSATFNAANQMSVLTGLFKQGTVSVTYTFEYNAANQLVKVIYADGGTNANTKTISYNAAGKISKITTVYVNIAIATNTVDYTWNGDNLATASTGTYTTTYVSFDDKLNPYSLANGIAVVFYGLPPSKNNVTEIKTVNGGITNVQKRVYEYNTAGYATSMKLTDGSNEGQKYYYAN